MSKKGTMDATELLQNIIKKRQCQTSINIAVCCSALFDLSEDLKVHQDEGPEAFLELQRDKENDVLAPGTAFVFIKALDAVNKHLLSLDKTEDELFDVVLMSPNNSASGLRLLHSVERHGLSIQRMCFTDGASPIPFLEAYNIQLFLSTVPEHVTEALKLGILFIGTNLGNVYEQTNFQFLPYPGIAAATLYNQKVVSVFEDQLRIAFDLDSVLFSDETEQVLKAEGLLEYIKYEKNNAKKVTGDGPLKNFAMAIGRMQEKFRKHRTKFVQAPIRTYVVTARGSVVAERALRTLQHWGIEINEAHFLALAPKGPVLNAIRPHIFFDDSLQNIEEAITSGIPAAHVGPTKT